MACRFYIVGFIAVRATEIPVENATSSAFRVAFITNRITKVMRKKKENKRMTGAFARLLYLFARDTWEFVYI